MKNLFPPPRPWDPGLVSAELASRERNRAERGTGHEAYPRMEDVSAYFGNERRAESGSEQIRSPRAAEEELIHDLELAQMNGEPDEERADMLRRLIWANSRYREYPEQSLKRAVQAAKNIARELRDEPVEKRGMSSGDIADAEEALEKRAERMEALGNAIKLNVRGREVKEQGLLEEIEFAFSEALHALQKAPKRSVRTRLEPRLSDLRVLRDALYHSYLFPEWTGMKHRSEFGGARRPKVA
jgi:hypothetical protein